MHTLYLSLDPYMRQVMNVAGLENAPAACIGLLEGRNFGKLLVRVTDISGETN